MQIFFNGTLYECDAYMVGFIGGIPAITITWPCETNMILDESDNFFVSEDDENIVKEGSE